MFKNYHLLAFTANSVSAASPFNDDKEIKTLKSFFKAFPYCHDYHFTEAIQITPQNILSFLRSVNLDEHEYHSIVHFTKDSGMFNKQTIKLGLREQPVTLQEPALCQVLKKLSNRLQLIIFNGDNTRQLAKSMAASCDFSIGTTRNISSKEASSFTGSFYSFLTVNRVLCNESILKAFFHSARDQMDEEGHLKEHPYILFTKKTDKMSNEVNGQPKVMEIRDAENFGGVQQLVKQLNESYLRMKTLEEQLHTDQRHTGMIKWLDERGRNIIESVAQQIFPSSENERIELTVSLENFMLMIKAFLRVDSHDREDLFTIPYSLDKKYYEQAFRLIDNAIPLKDGAFEPYSRHFLAVIFRNLSEQAK